MKSRVYGKISLEELEGLLRDKAIEECPFDTDTSICLRAADIVYHYSQLNKRVYDYEMENGVTIRT